MRSRYVYNPQGELIYAIERGVVTCDKRDETDDPGYMVMPDIQPYQNMVNGGIITSRSKHREFLKQHNLVEIGNEKQKSVADLRKTGVKESLVASMQRAKEQYGTRHVEKAISETLNRAYELRRR